MNIENNGFAESEDVWNELELFISKHLCKNEGAHLLQVVCSNREMIPVMKMLFSKYWENFDITLSDLSILIRNPKSIPGMSVTHLKENYLEEQIRASTGKMTSNEIHLQCESIVNSTNVSGLYGARPTDVNNMWVAAITFDEVDMFQIKVEVNLPIPFLNHPYCSEAKMTRNAYRRHYLQHASYINAVTVALGFRQAGKEEGVAMAKKSKSGIFQHITTFLHKHLQPDTRVVICAGFMDEYILHRILSILHEKIKDRSIEIELRVYKYCSRGLGIMGVFKMLNWIVTHPQVKQREHNNSGFGLILEPHLVDLYNQMPWTKELNTPKSRIDYLKETIHCFSAAEKDDLSNLVSDELKTSAEVEEWWRSRTPAEWQDRSFDSVKDTMKDTECAESVAVKVPNRQDSSKIPAMAGEPTSEKEQLWTKLTSPSWKDGSLYSGDVRLNVTRSTRSVRSDEECCNTPAVDSRAKEDVCPLGSKLLYDDNALKQVFERLTIWEFNNENAESFNLKFMMALPTNGNEEVKALLTTADFVAAHMQEEETCIPNVAFLEKFYGKNKSFIAEDITVKELNRKLPIDCPDLRKESSIDPFDWPVVSQIVAPQNC